MRPKDFKRWRKSLGLSQKDAAEQLGLKRRVVQYYEKGERDGKDVDIPKSVRLACYAISEGVSDYHGPREQEGRPAGAADDAVRVKSQDSTGGSRINGASPDEKAAPRAKPHKSGKGPSKAHVKEHRKAAKKSKRPVLVSDDA